MRREETDYSCCAGERLGRNAERFVIGRPPREKLGGKKLGLRNTDRLAHDHHKNVYLRNFPSACVPKQWQQQRSRWVTMWAPMAILNIRRSTQTTEQCVLFSPGLHFASVNPSD